MKKINKLACLSIMFLLTACGGSNQPASNSTNSVNSTPASETSVVSSSEKETSSSASSFNVESEASSSVDETPKEQSVTLSIAGYESDGVTSLVVPADTKVTLQGPATYEAKVTDSGTLDLVKALPGTYKVTAVGFQESEVTIPNGGGAVTISLIKEAAKEQSVTITVNLFQADGTSALPSISGLEVKLVGETTYTTTLKDDGTLSIEKMFAGSYVVSAKNFNDANLVIPENGGEVSISLSKKAISVTAEDHPLNVNDSETIKVIDFDSPEVLYWERYYHGSQASKRGCDDVITTDSFNYGGGDYDGSTDANSGVVIKANGENNKGFSHFFMGDNAFSSSITISKDVKKVRIYSGSWGTDDITFKMNCGGVEVASQTFKCDTARPHEIEFNIDTASWDEGATENVTIEMSTKFCSACMVAGIALIGEAQSYDVTVQEKAVAGATVTLDNSTIKYGEVVSGSISASEGYRVVGVKLNGLKFDLNEGRFSAQSTILGVNKSNAKVEVEAILTDIAATMTQHGQVEAINLDVESCMYWERYENDGVTKTKEGATDLVISNQFAGYSRGGGDFGVDITAGGETNQSFVCSNKSGTEDKSFDAELKIVKGVKKICIYTGTWDGGFDMVFTLSHGDTTLNTLSFNNGGTRVHVVEIEINTTNWADDREENFKLNISHGNNQGQAIMCAGIAFFNA